MCINILYEKKEYNAAFEQKVDSLYYNICMYVRTVHRYVCVQKYLSVALLFYGIAKHIDPRAGTHTHTV